MTQAEILYVGNLGNLRLMQEELEADPSFEGAVKVELLDNVAEDDRVRWLNAVPGRARLRHGEVAVITVSVITGIVSGVTSDLISDAIRSAVSRARRRGAVEAPKDPQLQEQPEQPKPMDPPDDGEDVPGATP